MYLSLLQTFCSYYKKETIYFVMFYKIYSSSCYVFSLYLHISGIYSFFQFSYGCVFFYLFVVLRLKSQKENTAFKQLTHQDANHKTDIKKQYLTILFFWCLRSESNQRHEDFQSSALPTELQRHICIKKWRPGWGSNPRPPA